MIARAGVSLGILAAFCFAAILAVLLADWIASGIKPFEDGPRRTTLNPLWAIAVLLALGIVLVLRHATPVQLACIAAICIPLVAAWYVDARTGIVPDRCTLVPLIVVAIVAAVTARWVSLFSAFVVFVPFAAAAALSRGRGMGWGDVKLATLCASLIGLMAALPAFAVACLTATAVAYRRDRGTTPIAFGPYLVLVTLAALPFTIGP